MTVTSRQDSSKHEYEQKKKKDQKREQEEKAKSSVEEFETFELIEYGRLLFAKRNKELKLFMKGYVGKSEVGVRKSEDGDGDWSSEVGSRSSEDGELEEIFAPEVMNLSHLLEQYNAFFHL